MGKTNKPLVDPVPSRLYKYRCWTDKYHRRMLTHNAVYFASARKFNDPFDCRIPVEIEEVSDSYVRERMVYLLKQSTPNISEAKLQDILDYEMSQRTWENPVKLQKWHDNHQKAKFNQGIFGVSEPKDNLLMWSHYADSHKGFCVGFDREILDSCFKSFFEEDAKHLVMLEKVEYQREYPRFRFFEMAPQDFYIKALASKSADWIYEQEYRFIRMDKADFEYQLDNGIIVEVIFGCEMPDDHKSVIKDILREEGGKIELFEARMKEKSFGLDVIPVDY